MDISLPDNAACLRTDLTLDAWFALADPEVAPDLATEAVAVCVTCPARADCLHLAADEHAWRRHVGIRGGYHLGPVRHTGRPGDAPGHWRNTVPVIPKPTPALLHSLADELSRVSA